MNGKEFVEYFNSHLFDHSENDKARKMINEQHPTKDAAIETLRNYIKCYDRENEGCDYDCEKCGLDISHEELVNAIRVIVDL